MPFAVEITIQNWLEQIQSKVDGLTFVYKPSIDPEMEDDEIAILRDGNETEFSIQCGETYVVLNRHWYLVPGEIDSFRAMEITECGYRDIDKMVTSLRAI